MVVVDVDVLDVVVPCAPLVVGVPVAPAGVGSTGPLAVIGTCPIFTSAYSQNQGYIELVLEILVLSLDIIFQKNTCTYTFKQFTSICSEH